ncbi:MAG: sugar phosphate isomerase/epimerase [Clostridiales Family XIII bacterium]|jgi:sugar phosphate isomerase/epimerase|nr:sugar phosphate isomerase/epimerase [Clostridiales Family XIII bacterium]
MKLGLMSAILPDLTFEKVIDYCAETGFECAEICCWPKGKATRRYGGITHIDIEAADAEKLAYYVHYAKERGVTISSLGYYPNPMDADKEAADKARKHIRKLIDASAAMGIGLITTFIGKDKNLTVEENLKLFKRVWTPIMKHAEQKRVRIAIEICPMLFTKDEWPGGNNLAAAPYIWRQMFELVPSDYLGLNWDPSHPYLQGMDNAALVREWGDKIFHVHFKDILIRQDKLNEYGAFAYPALWHFPKLPGLGGVDMPAFVSALNDIRYDGYAVIEVEDKAFEGSLADIKRGIEQSYRYMRTLV